MATIEKWLFYALGGGLGHLTRALALARAVRRRDEIDIEILSNSPFAETVIGSGETAGVHVTKIPFELAKEETADRVMQRLQREDYSTLLVDVFPRGLGGELSSVIADSDFRSVLVQRDLTPRYGMSARVLKASLQYDVIIRAGEGLQLPHPDQVSTDAWVIRDRSELLAPPAARRMLNVSADAEKVVGVIATGTPDEVMELRHLAASLQQRLGHRVHVTLVDACRRTARATDSGSMQQLLHWPFVELMPGCDLLIGAGGYNTVYESRLSGVRLLAIPRPRLYDEQHARLKRHGIRCTDISRVADDAERMLAESDVQPETPANGVHDAAAILANAHADPDELLFNPLPP